jgi:hypothetical protein
MLVKVVQPADGGLGLPLVELFHAWHGHHRERPIKAVDLAEPVRISFDPHARGRQFIASRLTQLSGTDYTGSCSAGKGRLANAEQRRMPFGARNCEGT